MDKHVIPSTFWFNEPETFCGVEPFYCAQRHIIFSQVIPARPKSCGRHHASGWQNSFKFSVFQMPWLYNYANKNKIKGNFMQFYGLKACDSCSKARKALQNQQVEYIDVREGHVPDTVLQAALEKFGDAMLNRASTTWRGLDEVTRAGDPLALLKAYPTLMKRPLIVRDGGMTLGWKPDVAAYYAALPEA